MVPTRECSMPPRDKYLSTTLMPNYSSCSLGQRLSFAQECRLQDRKAVRKMSRSFNDLGMQTTADISPSTVTHTE